MLIKYFLLLKKIYRKIISLRLGSYTYSNFRVKKKKKSERFTSLSESFLPDSSGLATRSELGQQRSSEAGVKKDYRIQRSLETPAAPSLLATSVSLRSDAVKTNPDWSGSS